MVRRQGIVIVGEIVRGRNVVVVVRESHGEFSGRIHLPRQDIDHRIGAFLARRPGQDDGIHEMLPGSRLDHAADIEDDHDPLPFAPIGVVQVLQQFPFGCGNLEIARQPAVLSLAGLAAEHHDGHVVDRGLIGNGRTRQWKFLPVFAVFLEFQVKTGLQGFRTQFIIAFESGLQFESRRFQSLRHRHYIGFGHLARAGAARDESLGGHAVQGHLFRPLQRQRLPLVAEQDDGLGRRFPR